MDKENNRNENWRKIIAPYMRPDVKRSVWQVINTIVPFFLLWYLAYLSLSVSYWLTLVPVCLAAGLLVRIFIIFHDCCHGSFFPNRKANEVLGTLTGILTCCPFHQWRHSHSVHHATSGNLDRHGTGDIWTLTVEEYLALPRLKRMAYRMYRNPLVMFGLGPTYLFLIEYRFNRKGARRKERMNTYITNLGIAAVAGLLCWSIGWKEFLLIQGPIFLISGLAGVWLFYVQHQFEGTYFEKDEKWDYVEAALRGSSFYKLPKILHWFTGNIGFHHIHHLSPRVPNYYLHHVHKKNTMFQSVNSITLLSSLKSLNFRIWDENRKKLMGFGYIKRFLKAEENRTTG
ncbi:omega-6 fatty acid desaturase (delta-12 desaturase) [Melghirimyces profundicolus]|uniref:Omega-6 fatty acid desaturase (Delta-12 desaturase) n=2 Tax=Melghirimyces profundicolus TaxID=1242148 RepID=A0A2T6C4N8_9BACL|nr:fatty acid desaturase [Melghirimyces profundicolus]PTX63278.1 omega-6 fatty acid desaturase (delta-12 desaturase) [Melghirimyces profundicolus]